MTFSGPRNTGELNIHVATDDASDPSLPQVLFYGVGVVIPFLSKDVLEVGYRAITHLTNIIIIVSKN